MFVAKRNRRLAGATHFIHNEEQQRYHDKHRDDARVGTRLEDASNGSAAGKRSGQREKKGKQGNTGSCHSIEEKDVEEYGRRRGAME